MCRGASRSAVVGDRVTVEIGGGGADLNAGAVDVGETEFVVGASGHAESAAGVGPEVRGAVVEAGPVALVSEGGRAGRAHLHAQVCQVVGERPTCACRDADSVDRVGVSKGAGWTAQDASVCIIIAKGTLQSH